MSKFCKNTYSSKNEKWLLENGLNFFPKFLNSQKVPKLRTILDFGTILKQRVFGENWNWTAKDNAQSICQVKQYAQDIDAEVITMKPVTKFELKNPDIINLDIEVTISLYSSISKQIMKLLHS